MSSYQVYPGRGDYPSALRASKPRTFINPWSPTAGTRAPLLPKTPAPRVPGGTAPAAPADPYAGLQAQIDTMLKTYLDAVEREKQAAYQQMQREAAAELQRGQALAEGLKALGISDAVQRAFGNAATAQAGLAQGFSGQIRDQASAQAAQQQQMLSGTGQEGAVRNEGEAMGNVQYGLGGFMPSTALNTMAAAFGADAALQPGFAMQFGAMNEAARRAKWADEELPQFTNKRLEILDKKPELLREAIADYEKSKVEKEEKAYKRWLDKQNLSLKKQSAKAKRDDEMWNRKVDAARIDQSAYRLNQGDRSLDLRARQYAQSNQQAWARIGISNRNAQLSAARLELAIQKYKNPNTRKSSGLTPSAVRLLKKSAGEIASDAWNGVNPQADGSRDYMSYQEAMREGLARGVPLTMMQNALNRFWRKPGMHTERDATPGSGRPKVPFQLRNPKPIKNAAGVDASNQIVADALEYGPQSGVRYVFGGASPDQGFDCSGFTKFMVAKHKGVDLPHNAAAQFNDPRGKSVPTPALQPGDVVFFRSSPNPGSSQPPWHNGYYIGNGKYVEYYSSGKPARVSSLSSRRDFMGARRFG